MNRLSLFILLCCLLAFTCTHNPFFEDKISGGGGTAVRGTVTLSDGETPDRIYVWLEGVNAGTYTNSLGQYELFIPPAEVQPGGGLSGSFDLYYYCGNYQFTRQTLFLVRGLVQYDQAGVNRSGQMADVTLTKVLDLSAILETDSIADDSEQDFWLYYSLGIPSGTAVGNIRIELFHKTGDYNGIANIFFLPLNAPVSHAILYTTSGNRSTRWMRNSETKIFSDETQNFELPPGQYKVIPYLHVLQENLPPDLIRSLGGETDPLSYKFLNIPYKRDMPILTVAE